jgi:cytochrome c
MKAMRRSLVWIIAGLLWVVCLAACGDPYADIKLGMSPADAERFERGRHVATPCWTCHDLTGEAIKLGPPLRGVFGRRIGSATGYGYSDGFLGADFVWNESQLNAFLADPQGYMVGTRMVSPGVRDPGQRRDLIFFLRHATQPH